MRTQWGIMKNSTIAIVLSLMTSVAFLVPSATLQAASSGGKCSRVGVTQKTKGVTFTCVRVGKSLKWARKYSQQGATSTTLPTSIADQLRLNPVSPEPLNSCRLVDARTIKTGGDGQAITYPASPNNGFVNSGTINVAVVFVDFPDVQGGSSELSEHMASIKKAAAWYSWFSQGNVNYNLRIANTWVRAPQGSENYFWLHPGKSGIQRQSDREISNAYRSLAASVLNTDDVTAIWVVIPKAVTAIDEGFAYRALPNVFSNGSDTYRGNIPIWQHFVHETLHSHGALGHSPKNAQIGLFWNTGSAGATLNSWDAMTLGWMKQENMYCATRDNVSTQTMTLVPLEREQMGLRSVIIKLTDYEALVIESHRKDTWSERWPTGTYGVSVMKIDTRIDTVWDLGSSTGRYLVPAQDHSLDFMKVGQSFTTDGIKISLVATGTNDQIKIERIG